MPEIGNQRPRREFPVREWKEGGGWEITDEEEEEEEEADRKGIDEMQMYRARVAASVDAGWRRRKGGGMLKFPIF